MKRKMLVALLLVAVLTLGAVLPAFAATGSWKINTKVGTYLSKADKKVFDKAVKGMKGVTYTPVLKLAEKTVNGKNYAFLCTAKAVTKSPKYSWKVLLINASSSGEVELLKVNSFSYKNPKTQCTLAPPRDSMSISSPSTDFITSGPVMNIFEILSTTNT